MKMHVFTKKNMPNILSIQKEFLPLQPQKEKNTLRKQAKLRLGRIKARPVRLSVRTQDFHS